MIPETVTNVATLIDHFRQILSAEEVERFIAILEAEIALWTGGATDGHEA